MFMCELTLIRYLLLAGNPSECCKNSQNTPYTAEKKLFLQHALEFPAKKRFLIRVSSPVKNVFSPPTPGQEATCGEKSTGKTD